MQIHPYLAFNGQCQAAFKFYTKCLGGKTTFSMTYGESPMAKEMPAEIHGKIMHTRFEVGDNVLMGADACSERFEAPRGISISINLKDPVEAERIFRGLSEGGKVTMPIEETFWAVRFGMLVDQFGIPWMINCEKNS